MLILSLNTFTLYKLYQDIKTQIMVRKNELILFCFQMSYAPAAEMDASDFNKHWNVMSNVSIETSCNSYNL